MALEIIFNEYLYSSYFLLLLYAHSVSLLDKGFHLSFPFSPFLGKCFLVLRVKQYFVLYTCYVSHSWAKYFLRFLHSLQTVALLPILSGIHPDCHTILFGVILVAALFYVEPTGLLHWPRSYRASDKLSRSIPIFSKEISDQSHRKKTINYNFTTLSSVTYVKKQSNTIITVFTLN